MKVIATQSGFCGLTVRLPGEHFEIADHLFSPVWMIREDAGTSEPVAVTPTESLSPAQRLIAFLQKDIRHIF